MLNLEISDNFKKPTLMISCLYKVTREIKKNLPRYMCQKFYKTQEFPLQKLFKHEKDRLSKKTQNYANVQRKI